MSRRSLSGASGMPITDPGVHLRGVAGLILRRLARVVIAARDPWPAYKMLIEFKGLPNAERHELLQLLIDRNDCWLAYGVLRHIGSFVDLDQRQMLLQKIAANHDPGPACETLQHVRDLRDAERRDLVQSVIARGNAKWALRALQEVGDLTDPETRALVRTVIDGLEPERSYAALRDIRWRLANPERGEFTRSTINAELASAIVDRADAEWGCAALLDTGSLHDAHRREFVRLVIASRDRRLALNVLQGARGLTDPEKRGLVDILMSTGTCQAWDGYAALSSCSSALTPTERDWFLQVIIDGRNPEPAYLSLRDLDNLSGAEKGQLVQAIIDGEGATPSDMAGMASLILTSAWERTAVGDGGLAPERLDVANHLTKAQRCALVRLVVENDEITSALDTLLFASALVAAERETLLQIAGRCGGWAAWAALYAVGGLDADERASLANEIGEDNAWTPRLLSYVDRLGDAERREFAAIYLGKSAPRSGENLPRWAPFPDYEQLLRPEGWAFTRAAVNIHRLVPDAPIACDSLDQFISRCITSVEVPARIYASRNRVSEIVIPEEYAAQLDALREMCKTARSSSQREDNPKSDEAARHPYVDRVSPEHVDYLLSRLPDSGAAIKRIYVLDETDPMDHWRAQIYAKPNFRAAASCNPNSIWLWKLEYRNGGAADCINHEWGHQLQWRRGSFGRLHELAMEWEPEVPGVPPEERWADLVEALLNRFPDMLTLELMDSPIQTSVVARAVGVALRRASTPSLAQEDLRSRLSHLAKKVEPIACRRLAAMVGSKDEKRSGSVRQLLLFLSQKDETEA